MDIRNSVFYLCTIAVLFTSCSSGTSADSDSAVSSSTTPITSSAAAEAESSAALSSSAPAISSSTVALSSTETSSSSSVAMSSSAETNSSSSVAMSSSSETASSASVSACGDFDADSLFCDARDTTLYPYVTIGTQVWMAKNLNYGSLIPSTSDQSDDATAEKYCVSDNESFCDYYGGLYQWAEALGLSSSYNAQDYSVSGNIQGICPDGWHVPSTSEWSTLRSFIGDSVGYHLKSAVEGSWTTNPSTGLGGPGDDAYGFNGLGGGGRYFEGYMSTIMSSGSTTSYFGWVPKSIGGSAFRGLFLNTKSSSDSSQVNHLGDDQTGLGQETTSKSWGFSLRCIKD